MAMVRVLKSSRIGPCFGERLSPLGVLHRGWAQPPIIVKAVDQSVFGGYSALSLFVDAPSDDEQ